MYKAKINFAGIISMKKGEVKNIADKALANDLIKAGYIEDLNPAEDKKPVKKTTTKRGK